MQRVNVFKKLRIVIKLRWTSSRIDDGLSKMPFKFLGEVNGKGQKKVSRGRGLFLLEAHDQTTLISSFASA